MDMMIIIAIVLMLALAGVLGYLLVYKKAKKDEVKDKATALQTAIDEMNKELYPSKFCIAKEGQKWYEVYNTLIPKVKNNIDELKKLLEKYPNRQAEFEKLLSQEVPTMDCTDSGSKAFCMKAQIPPENQGVWSEDSGCTCPDGKKENIYQGAFSCK